MTPSTPPRREMSETRWGDPARASTLPSGLRDLVAAAFALESVPAAVPPVGEPGPLPPVVLTPEALTALVAAVGHEHVLVDDDHRRARARGRSTADLLRARGEAPEPATSGSSVPDAVVRPGDADEVAAVLAVAVEHRLAVVPFGGGTGVVGGLQARRSGFAGVVSLDLARMRRLLAVDRVSMTVTLEPGLRGPEAEELLGELGLTLGHFPQSFEYATLGGFAATRSSGQSSAGYGRFDAMVAGVDLATPRGALSLGRAPASAAGPDLRQLVLGSEGAFGVITALTLRVRPVPQASAYNGWWWPDLETGAEAMRHLAQHDLLPTVLRLSDETETALNLARPDEVGEQAHGADTPGGGCLMIVGHEGEPALLDARRTATATALSRLGGTPLGIEPGESWLRGRFAGPYLRDSLLDAGVLVETLETACFWSARERTYAAVGDALRGALGDGAIVMAHVSHVYYDGCSLYFTVAARQEDDPVAQWARAKAAATDAMVASGATITHHHAVGTDHLPWLADEIGPLGVDVLRAVKRELDPTGICNPGVLVG